jgi:hypothetical protein
MDAARRCLGKGVCLSNRSDYDSLMPVMATSRRRVRTSVRLGDGSCLQSYLSVQIHAARWSGNSSSRGIGTTDRRITGLLTRVSGVSWELAALPRILVEANFNFRPMSCMTICHVIHSRLGNLGACGGDFLGFRNRMFSRFLPCCIVPLSKRLKQVWVRLENENLARSTPFDIDWGCRQSKHVDLSGTKVDTV